MRALNWSGLGRQKVLGRTFLEVDWWGAGQNAAAWLKTAMGRAVDGEPVHGNLELVQTRGSGQIEFSLTPVPDEFGRIEYVVMECRDITLTEHDIDELKRAQDALRGQARWLETVLESVSDGLIATGADGHIRLINSAAQTLTGWKMREAVGRPLEEVFRIVDESTRGPLECPGVTVLREGRVVELANHAVLLARDGTERPITDGGAPIRDEDGSILGGVLCFHDASLRRQAELAVAPLGGDRRVVGRRHHRPGPRWSHHILERRRTSDLRLHRGRGNRPLRHSFDTHRPARRVCDAEGAAVARRTGQKP